MTTPIHVEPIDLPASPADLVEALGPARTFLLESALDPDRLGRWSFLGPVGPPILTARGRRCRLEEPDGTVREWEADPLDAARELWSRFRVAPSPDAPPFRGGLVGWFGYELARVLERLPGRAAIDLDVPDVLLAAATEVVAIDHRDRRAYLSVLGSDGPGRARRLRERLATVPPRAEPDPEPEPDARGEWTCPFDRDSYAQIVEEARRRIRDGLVFEVCLTRRLEAASPVAPWPLYRMLRRRNPAPFAAWLSFPEATVVSSSPERFLRVDPAGRVETRPMKGTRPRGRDAGEDARLAHDLAASEKDRAENLMIVDLARNDLGRVCRFGTVRVPRLLEVETHPTVFQLVSEVAGELAPGRDALDAVRAAFPPGSMTGAPKIEAMKTIDDLEPVARGVYSGALGYLDAAGGLDLSVVIRTFVQASGRLTFAVGGAVVSDSDPAAEFDETVHKARALVAAASLARG